MKWKWTCVLVRAVPGPHWTILNAFEITELWGGKPHSKNKKQEISKQNNGLRAALLEAGSLHLLRGMCGQEGWVGGGSAARKSSRRRAGASTAGDAEQELCHVVSPKPVFSTRPEVRAQPCGTSSALAQDRQAGVVTEPQSHGPTEPPESPAALPIRVCLHRPAQSKHASFLSLQPPGIPWRSAAPL